MSVGGLMHKKRQKIFSFSFRFLFTAFLLSLSSFSNAQLLNPSLASSLSKAAPDLNPSVLYKAIASVQCAVSHGEKVSQRLAIIDFSLPSTAKRLWIFDLPRRALILNDFVAHGNNSGENYANQFSNIEGSHQSSLGLFKAQETYYGKHGYSLKLDGLEKGINDKARERFIVIHGADYVNPDWIAKQGRIGRSQGCPAVRNDIAKTVIDSLKGGQFVFKFFPDDHWLSNSDYLNCPASQLANR